MECWTEAATEVDKPMSPPEDDLSAAAVRYIASLVRQDSRRDATDYAVMDRQEFQARFGPAMDEIDEKVTRILKLLSGPGEAMLTQGPLTRAAVWAESSPGKRMGALVAIVTALTSMIVAAGQLLEHFASGNGP